jgi:hypothetical protein
MSLIKANAVQIGQSPTATQNFTLAVPSAPDGTIKLARGNAGATTQDVLNVDASGNVSFAGTTGLGNISNSTAIATGSTTARSLANRFADVANVLDFGAVGDGSTDNNAAILAAIATGKPIWFPENNINQYRFSTSITTTNNTEIYTDNSVQLYYTGSTGAAINLVGSKIKISLGEVLAPNAPYAIRYYNLEFSEISIRRPGSCQQTCIYHDGDLQTANAGNNRWIVEDVQAGSVPYGIRIKNSTSFSLEGEIWDVKVIFSATNTAFRIGESSTNNLCRWNTYRIAADAQGITPLLIDVYQDSNNIELINWAGLVSPPIAHVRFNTGTGNNMFLSGPGVQDPIQVLDNGTNFCFVQGDAGQRIFKGQLLLGIPAGGTTTDFQVGSNRPSGDIIAAFENTSNNNNITKYASIALRGRDTVNSGKNVAQLMSIPQDADWNNATTVIYGRNSNALSPYAFLGGNGSPENSVVAPVGAIYTRRDGGAGTTLYVKQSGSGNTGWVAK